ncbi:hypothetical protein CNMCM8057_005921 [Aspergillus fumigatus]|nr:hypothetical protein CNMCM8057_005921 [Aspergillus fumigatus]KAF4295859.1 hypothetical protein CNMCM8686_005928 [Aspergillus fumigatus]KAJ8147228.1 hypothetical protein LV165_008889 [Aspergillus fumigatus]
MLLPVDVALVSSTISSALGQREEWATQEEVDKITYSLTIIYYSLYFLDALLCFVGIPFAYFWHEEYDEVAFEAGDQTACKRFWAATKYTLTFIAVVIALVLVGFFAPMMESQPGHDLGYWRGYLIENRTYLIVLVASLVRSPRLDERQLEEDVEEAEEESLLASTRRSGNPT